MRAVASGRMLVARAPRTQGAREPMANDPASERSDLWVWCAYALVLAGVTAIIVMFKLRTRYGVALEELRAEVNALRKELATLRAELRNLNLALAELLEAARRGEQR